ncbi:hypothetical protein ACFY36_05830 [Actinoplanes sp. NPDC000266]
MLAGAYPEDVVAPGKPPLSGTGDGRWSRVDAGYMQVSRASIENESSEGAWTSPRADFTVAAYVLDDPHLADALGGTVVGVAGPVPSANHSLAGDWTRAESRESSWLVDKVVADPNTRLPHEFTVLAIRYRDDLGAHLVDLAGPYESPIWAGMTGPDGLTGLTLRIDRWIVNVLPDNQLFLADVAPAVVPEVITRAGAALWRRRP